MLGYYTTSGRIGFTTAMTPFRAVDTRASTPLAPGETRLLDTFVLNAESILVNVTAVDPSATGFLTVFPTDGGRPDASNVNFTAGRASPNLVLVKPGADGKIRVFNSAGSTHVLIDVIGTVDT